MAFVKSYIKSRTHQKGSQSIERDTTLRPSMPSTGTMKQPLVTCEAVNSPVTSTNTADISSSTKHSLNTHSPSSSETSLTTFIPSPSLNLSFTRLRQTSSVPHTTSFLTQPQPKPNLPSLPPEILLQVINSLPFNSLLSLRSTCSRLHSLLSPNHLPSHRRRITTHLIQSEKSQLANYRCSRRRQPYQHFWDLFYAAFEWQLQERPAKHLMCYGCFETKPLNNFVERMSSRGTGLGGSAAQHRRCKECMRRFYAIGGSWWREHWVPKSDHRKRRSRGERVSRWITKGEKLVETVEKGKEIGVCACCGGRLSELWWGCTGCFEKEERRWRRRDGEKWGVGIDEDEIASDGFKGWVMSKSGSLRAKHDKKQRKKDTRRFEGGRWWRRMYRRATRGGIFHWEGSWDDRVESLFEWVTGTNRNTDENDTDDNCDTESDDNDDGANIEPTEILSLTPTPRRLRRRASAQHVPQSSEWSPLTDIPLPPDRRETRCAMCWTPRCRKAIFMLGLAYEKNLRYDRWCGDCQREDAEKRGKRRWRMGTGVGREGEEGDDDEEEVLEGMQRLFHDG